MILMIELRDKEIILKNKVLNVLDEFACGVFPIIEKFFDYVIVGGYVAILLGRTRTTEDIDTVPFFASIYVTLVPSDAKY